MILPDPDPRTHKDITDPDLKQRLTGSHGLIAELDR